jgi:hypothetical protein
MGVKKILASTCFKEKSFKNIAKPLSIMIAV